MLACNACKRHRSKRKPKLCYHAKLQAHPFSMKALRLEPDVAVKLKLIPVKLQKGKMGKLRCLAETAIERRKKKTGAGRNLGEVEDHGVRVEDAVRGRDAENTRGNPNPTRGLGFPSARERKKERERERDTASTKAPDKDKNEEDKQLKNRHGSGREGLKRPDNNTDPWEITMASQRTDKDLKSQKQKPDKNHNNIPEV